MSRNDQYQYMLSIAALVMSALAMIFAFMELRSSDRQYEANVWPYVDLDIIVSSDNFEIAASNKGMGPALIHEFRLLHDGEVVRVPSDLLERAGFSENTDLSLSSSTVTSTVMSTGERLTALRIQGAGTGTAISTILQELEIELCYCSINGACWTNLGDQQFRAEVAQCGSQSDNVEERLRLFSPDQEDSP